MWGVQTDNGDVESFPDLIPPPCLPTPPLQPQSPPAPVAGSNTQALLIDSGGHRRRNISMEASSAAQRAHARRELAESANEVERRHEGPGFRPLPSLCVVSKRC